nr:unnamed protein product [Callosobruchus analis]
MGKNEKCCPPCCMPCPIPFCPPKKKEEKPPIIYPIDYVPYCLPDMPFQTYYQQINTIPFFMPPLAPACCGPCPDPCGTPKCNSNGNGNGEFKRVNLPPHNRKTEDPCCISH